MMRTPADHFGHVLRLFIDGCGPQDGTRRRLLADKHLDRTGPGELAIQLVEGLRVLRERTGRKAIHDHLWSSRVLSVYVESNTWTGSKICLSSGGKKEERTGLL